MTDLRWVLLALGLLIIVGIVAWDRGLPQRWFAPLTRLGKSAPQSRRRVEPEVSIDESVVEQPPDEPVTETEDEPVRNEQPEQPEQQIDSVVTLRLVPLEGKFRSDKVVLALRSVGLKHGRYGIFHQHAGDISDEPEFSVASLTEPGSFDMARLTESTIAGMSMFMLLPGAGDPVARFDSMVAVARDLARKLDGEIRDEKGSSWSIQRERYIREEVIEYRHAQIQRASD